jgi:hypothetical protein
MIFEYEPREEDMSLCVAYIDRAGHLRIRDTGRTSDRERGAIVLRQAGEIKNGYLWEPETAQRRFYPGDRITITF